MKNSTPATSAERLMLEFAESTGLTGNRDAPRRYLWTDAFAVCNFLELFRRTNDAAYRDLALRLVDQVHHTLGRHRPDDTRTGWISGLPEEEGERRPTAGGLRIGKASPEPAPGEPADERLDWDRDGQYYHYLTEWMHALNRVAAITGEPCYLRWALELAQTAHARFTFSPRHGGRRMYWKMSIDLSRPLVPSMGQHDPLDGLVTLLELAAAAEVAPTSGSLPRVDLEIGELTEMNRGLALATDDPLGIGGLLFDAGRIVQLTMRGKSGHEKVLDGVLEAAVAGLAFFRKGNTLQLLDAYRLPFRELGLSIGLHGVEKMREWIGAHPGMVPGTVGRRLKSLQEQAVLGETIERHWLDAAHREAESWREHGDINAVMLATSLAPDSFLAV